jgi:hypothetical protein
MRRTDALVDHLRNAAPGRTWSAGRSLAHALTTPAALFYDSTIRDLRPSQSRDAVEYLSATIAIALVSDTPARAASLTVSSDAPARRSGGTGVWRDRSAAFALPNTDNRNRVTTHPRTVDARATSKPGVTPVPACHLGSPSAPAPPMDTRPKFSCQPDHDLVAAANRYLHAHGGPDGIRSTQVGTYLRWMRANPAQHPTVAALRQAGLDLNDVAGIPGLGRTNPALAQIDQGRGRSPRAGLSHAPSRRPPAPSGTRARGRAP